MHQRLLRPAGTVERGRVSYADYRDWKEQASNFDDLAAYAYRGLSITEGVESERFQASAVTWNLFALLGEARSWAVTLLKTRTSRERRQSSS